MQIIISIITVIFVVVSIILLLFILLQSNKPGGASILGNATQDSFGAKSSSVLIKSTGTLVAIFIVIALFLAWWQTYSNKSYNELDPLVSEENTNSLEATNTSESDVVDDPTSEETSQSQSNNQSNTSPTATHEEEESN